MEALEAIPGDRRLERLRQHAHRDERVAQVRRAQERLAPAADRVGEPPPDAARSQRPPWSPQHSSASDIHGSTSCSADSNPSTSSACVPSPAPVDPRLVGVDQPAVRRVQARLRQRPDRLGAGSEARRTGRPPRRGASGRGRTRTHASVITPRVPSEPISIRSGETPAPDPGAAATPTRPAGVSARTDSTRSSMCVYSVAKWPPGAGRDPAAERRELKRLREVAQRQPVLRELLLERRPGRPGLDPRRQRRWVDLEHAVERLQVDRDHPGVAISHARLDAADDARAAPERDHGRAGFETPTRAPPAPRPRRAGARRRPAGGRTRRGTRARCRGTSGRRSGGSARTARWSRSPPARRARAAAAPAASTSDSGTGCSRIRPSRTRGARTIASRGGANVVDGEGCSSSNPQPQCLGAAPQARTVPFGWWRWRQCRRHPRARTLGSRLR